MRDRWQAVIDRFGDLSTRERVLVLIALFAVAYQVGNLVVFDRQLEQVESLQAKIAADNRAVLTTNRQIAAMLGRVPEDPNLRLRESIEVQRSVLQQIRSALQAATAELISPRDMAKFLEQLLLQERELELLRLNTHEPEPLIGPSSKDPSTNGLGAGSVLHRHAFDIEFSGNYLATLRYLEALERLPWRFFWDSVDYEVIDYPESIVRLRLHTLSLSEDWIGV